MYMVTLICYWFNAISITNMLLSLVYVNIRYPIKLQDEIKMYCSFIFKHNIIQ